VNTGISPIGQADYTGVDEGGQAIGPGIGLNQFYSVWTLPHTLNSVTVSNNGAGESNMISLVASPELNPGDQYRLLFVTNSVTNAESADIAVYNALVAADAAAVPELDALGTTWTAVASTPTVDAVDNTMTDPSPAGPTGVPIYLINGRRFADDYDSLWTSDGPLVGGVPIPVGSLPFIPTSSGNSPPLRVWTGSSQLGVEHAAWGGLGDADGDAAIGTPEEGNIIFPALIG